jgi:hypothetical protein
MREHRRHESMVARVRIYPLSKRRVLPPNALPRERA